MILTISHVDSICFKNDPRGKDGAAMGGGGYIGVYRENLKFSLKKKLGLKIIHLSGSFLR